MHADHQIRIDGLCISDTVGQFQKRVVIARHVHLDAGVFTQFFAACQRDFQVDILFHRGRAIPFLGRAAVFAAVSRIQRDNQCAIRTRLFAAHTVARLQGDIFLSFHLRMLCCPRRCAERQHHAGGEQKTR